MSNFVKVHKKNVSILVILAVLMVLLWAVVFVSQTGLIKLDIPQSFAFTSLFLTAVTFAYIAVQTSLLKKEYRSKKYLRDFDVAPVTHALVAHISPADKNSEHISINDLTLLRSWFISLFGNKSEFNDQVGCTVSLFQGSSQKDQNIKYNLKKFLVNHPVDNLQYTDFEQYNKDFPEYFSSLSLSQANSVSSGLTAVFIFQTSCLYYQEKMEERLNEVLVDQNTFTLNLSKMFDTVSPVRPFVHLEHVELV